MNLTNIEETEPDTHKKDGSSKNGVHERSARSITHLFYIVIYLKKYLMYALKSYLGVDFPYSALTVNWNFGRIIHLKYLISLNMQFSVIKASVEVVLIKKKRQH